MHEFSGHNIRGNQTCCQGKTAQTAADPDSRPPNNRSILTPKQTSAKTKPAAQKKPARHSREQNHKTATTLTKLYATLSLFSY